MAVDETFSLDGGSEWPRKPLDDSLRPSTAGGGKEVWNIPVLALDLMTGPVRFD
jgi:hypothetical protein